jgi:hypothetical protein
MKIIFIICLFEGCGELSITKRETPRTKIIPLHLYDDFCELVFLSYKDSLVSTNGFEEAPRCIDVYDVNFALFIDLVKRCEGFDEGMIADLDMTHEFYEHIKELVLFDIRSVLHQHFFSHAVNWKIIKNSPVRRCW